MLKKFDKECEKILNKRNLKMESNGFSSADELLEEIFDIREFKDFNQFKKDQKLIDKIKMTDVEILNEVTDSLWSDNIEKLDQDDESEQQTYKFCKQLYHFLKEIY